MKSAASCLRPTRGCLRAGVTASATLQSQRFAQCIAALPAHIRASYHARGFSAAPIPGDHMKEGFGLPASAKQFIIRNNFRFDLGDVVPGLSLGYSTYGKLNETGTNAVIVGHSLTSNSCVHEWWGPLIGEGPEYMLDTSKYFIVCCNYLGSVYGSSGPLDTDPRTGQRFSADFPVATLRDNVRAQKHLLDALGVRRLSLAVGGSLGGMLAMEWACEFPDFVDRVVVIACVARHSDWAIGWGEAGRQAIFADSKWKNGYYDTTDPPLSGMNVARQLAMLSYRTPASFTDKFKRETVQSGRTKECQLAQGQGVNRANQNSSLAGAAYYDVERYLNYQGEKFTRRFDPLAYVRLTQLLDSHDVGRGRGEDYRAVLQRMKQNALVVGIDSDLLYPVSLPHRPFAADSQQGIGPLV